ncbi:hypothetical protein CQW23_11182 [Capsicum baccatum]|uniref:Uncharacterized protein n=1 Tax=Capsicum baccatum TaxID=33114 RepID=A0A2G2X1T1_CAPBA|nr:hypothetical protein CQW23_11182 [Capsicum baccatum]
MSPFFIDLEEKEPSTSWEARHRVSGLMRITKLARQSWLLAQQGGALPHRRRKRGSVRGGASGFQCIASKIRTSLPAEHCRPILEGNSWKNLVQRGSEGGTSEFDVREGLLRQSKLGLMQFNQKCTYKIRMEGDSQSRD